MKELKYITVSIDQLFLDPNNPRFPKDEIHDESDITSNKVQDSTRNRLKDLEDITNIKDSIITVGYIPVNSILVKRIENESNKYKVIEGNCRTLALKEINDELNNPLKLKKEIEESVKKVRVALIDEDNEFEYELLGITHLIGTKEWKPYSQAKFLVKKLEEEEGMDIAKVGEKFGLKVITTATLIRAYYAYNQAQNDEIFGKKVKPESFSHFIELIKKPKLREWLDWDGESKIFANSSELENFYKLIFGGENGIKKITMAIQIRKLELVKKYSDLWDRLLDENNKQTFDSISVEAQDRDDVENYNIENMRLKLNESKKNIGYLHKNIMKEYGEEIIKRLNYIKKEAENYILKCEEHINEE